MKSLLKDNPVLKILFPFILGIVLSWLYGISMLCSLSVFIVALLLMLATFLPRVSGRFFGVALFAAMVAFGSLLESAERTKMEVSWSGEKGGFEAQLCESPYVERGTTKVLAEVVRLGRDSVIGARREGLVEITFASCVEVERLSVGDRIFFEAKVDCPRNAGNPAEFDVEHFMYLKGVTGVVYLPIDGWRMIGRGNLTLSMRAMHLRDYILDIYSGLGFDKDVQSVLSALTVGEKRSLSRDVRDLYSTVGASHILALSGLHLGILYMILSIFFPLRGVGVKILLRELLIIAALWFFAFVGGLSPSILRAAILFSIISLGRLLQRNASPLNSLSFAALLMLVVSPRLLFDISFQLSFAAVAAILLLVNPLRKLLRFDEGGAVYRYLVDIVAVSTAAQIGTLPFIWYYFGSFPLYFVLTNLVAVPASFLIMFIAVFMFLFTPFAFVQQCLARLLNLLIGWMNEFFLWLAALPGASVELPHLNLLEMCAFAFLIVFAIFVSGRRKWMLRVFALVGMFLLVCFSLPHANWQSHIIFYNSRTFPAMQLIKSREHSYLLSSYPECEIQPQYIAEPYWRRERMSAPKIISDAYYRSFKDETVALDNGLLHFEGRTIAVLADEHWCGAESITPVDCIWLCRGFLGSLEELLKIYPSRYVVMDATLYPSSLKRIERECRRAGVRFIDLSQRGAVKMLCEKSGVRFIAVE